MSRILFIASLHRSRHIRQTDYVQIMPKNVVFIYMANKKLILKRFFLLVGNSVVKALKLKYTLSWRMLFLILYSESTHCWWVPQ